MRRAIVTAVAVLFVAIGATAQSKVEEHDHSIVMSSMAEEEHLAHLRDFVASMSSRGPIIPQPANINPEATTKAFTITARSFSFTVSPAPFVVNQGDVVTLTVTVPASDPSAVGHGVLMLQYIEGGLSVPRGQTKSITFTATTVGSFEYVCTQPTCGDGHSLMDSSMTVQPAANPAPTISSILPTSGSANGGTVVTISGSGFTSSATVKLGGTLATNVSITNSTSIQATTPAHAAGKVDVVVTNSDSQAATLAQAFTYTASAPTISSILPVSGGTSGGTVVTISGTGFSSGATVKFGGTLATSVSIASATSITATTPAHAGGKVDVVVTNSDTQTATLAQAFTYTVSAPTISSVSPASGSTSGGTSITITGTGFQSGATVTVGVRPATGVTVVSGTSITAYTPLGPPTEQLKVDVTVTNPDSLKATATGAFTYTVPPLAVVSVTPNTTVPSGTSGSGPIVVTIFGAGFTTALPSSVTVGGITATSVQVIDPVTMQATFPAHAAGSGDVVVTVGGTSATLKNGFSWQNPPPKHRAARH